MVNLMTAFNLSSLTVAKGYNKLAPPPAYTNFTGPSELGGAINAPNNATGYNTYIGMKYYPGPYDPSQCAASCQATTAYDQRHATNGFYKACVCLFCPGPSGRN